MGYKDWRKLSFTKETDEFDWGPEKGNTIKYVMKNNPNFIKWCFSNIKKFKLGKKMQVLWEDYK